MLQGWCPVRFVCKGRGGLFKRFSYLNQPLMKELVAQCECKCSLTVLVGLGMSGSLLFLFGFSMLYGIGFIDFPG